MISVSAIKRFFPTIPTSQLLMSAACVASLTYVIVDNNATINAIQASNQSLARRAASSQEHSIHYTVSEREDPLEVEGDRAQEEALHKVYVEQDHDMYRTSSGEPGHGGLRHKPLATLVTGDPSVEGSLDEEIIRRVVRRHRSELRHCYEKQLQKHPGLAGSVKIKFIIERTGSMRSAEVASSDLNNSEVEQCMLDKIRRWYFPEPTDLRTVEVTYPFTFSAPEPAPGHGVGGL